MQSEQKTIKNTQSTQAQLEKILITLPTEMVRLINGYLPSADHPADHVLAVMNNMKLDNTQKVAEVTNYCLALLEEKTPNGVACALRKISYEQKQILFDAWEKDAINIALKWYYQSTTESNEGKIRQFVNEALKHRERKLPAALLHALEVKLAIHEYDKHKPDRLLLLMKKSTLHLNLANTTLYRIDLSEINFEGVNLYGADFCTDVKVTAKQINDIIKTNIDIIPSSDPFYPAVEYFNPHKKLGIWQTAVSPLEVFHVLRLMSIIGDQVDLDYQINGYGPRITDGLNKLTSQITILGKDIMETTFGAMLARVNKRLPPGSEERRLHYKSLE